MRDVFDGTRYPDEAFDFVVIRSQFLVCNGPVFTVAVTLGRPEIEIAQPAGVAAPMQDLASHASRSDPRVGLSVRRGIGMLRVCDIERPRILVGVNLMWVKLLPVAGPVETPERHLIRPAMRQKVLCRIQPRSCFQQQNLEPAFGEFL